MRYIIYFILFTQGSKSITMSKSKIKKIIKYWRNSYDKHFKSAEG